MKIVFMGTPDYAVKTLEGLIETGHEVVAVFAQPDKPVGRKRVLTAPPVKVAALAAGIPVFQPDSIRNEAAIQLIADFKPDAIVVVAYGKILPKEVLEIPKFGCINGHASLLPKYRGAAPIQWAIINGETVTGVTVMRMDSGIDTGDILAQAKLEIAEDDTADSLFERLSVLSANLTVATLESLEKGEITPIKQAEEMATYAPIIKKEMAHLNFAEKTAEEICNAVRGFYSWPCAYFFLNGKRIKLIKARPCEKASGEPMRVLEAEERFVISCKDGTAVELLEIGPEGSKPMTARQFLNGNSLSVGMLVGETNG